MEGKILPTSNDLTSIETRSKNVSNISFNQISQLKAKNLKNEYKGNLKRNKVGTSEVVTFQTEETDEDLSLSVAKIIVYMLLRFICAYMILLRGQLHYWCLQSLSGCRVQGTQHCSKLTI